MFSQQPTVNGRRAQRGLAVHVPVGLLHALDRSRRLYRPGNGGRIV